MPLYEDKHNAENKIAVSENCRNQALFGTKEVIKKIAALLGDGKKVALDGWYGVEFKKIADSVASELEACGKKACFIDTKTIYKPVDEIKEYKRPYVTDDPGFGYVNSEGDITDVMDGAALGALKAGLKGGAAVYGPGAAAGDLVDAYDAIFYFDMTMQPMLWKMWGGGLIPFGFDAPDSGYNWKEYYYCDFYLLHKHRKALYERMDYYVEAIEFDALKLLTREAYHEIIETAGKYPIKQVQIFQPGPWGAYRYRDLWEVPGLECSAWNKMSGPELSVVIDFGADECINVPLLALLIKNEQITGEYMARECPDLFPLDIWLDDGYFPEKQRAERTSMPIHNHPGTDYVKRHFNEPLGRYETYYIAEAYEGANTWMGYYDDADLEAWEQKCRESNNLEVIENWKDYVANWPSNVGDLYLIPPGTAHGHGGNQMVLEMDTSPAVAGTEYSFFQYDFARNSWDDETKTMTGKPLKMHLDHGFNNEKWRRAEYVRENLLSRPAIVHWEKDFWMDRYSTIDEMPFEVERLHFYKRAEYSTHNKFLQIVTLTVGNGAVIRSLDHPERQTNIERLQCAAIPACFGDYEIISADGGFCTCVLFRMKKG